VTAPKGGESSRRSLVLGGGNALGAYHFGACSVLLGSGWEPDWVLGTSIGAVTGAILVGNPPETRLERLEEFWRQAAQAQPVRPWPGLPDMARARLNNIFAAAALGFGRPGLFSDRLPGLFSLLPWMPGDRAAKDHHPLAATLERLVDFDRLHETEQRFSFVTLDVETGEEVWFDSHRDRIEAEHLLAATALMPLFPPVQSGGRLLGDAGLANNLPLDVIFAEPMDGDHLCMAIDLFDIGHGRPGTLDEAAARAQDLLFASQSRRAIAAVKQTVEARGGEDIDVAVAHVALRAPGHQRALKALDFSRASLDERIQIGKNDMQAMLRRLEARDQRRGFSWIRSTDAP
jgi:NTE family protein